MNNMGTADSKTGIIEFELERMEDELYDFERENQKE